MTDLVLYLSSTNNAGSLTTARNLVTEAPSSGAWAASNTGELTGFGEMYAQGNAGAWPALTAAPAPSGNGYIFDLTTLEGQRFVNGLWRPALTLKTSSNTVTADVYVRAYKWSPVGTYTLIGACVAPATVITTGGVTPALPAFEGAGLIDFGVDERLYVDVVLNITANGSASTAATTSLGENAGATQGVITPGYVATPAAAALTVLDVLTRTAQKLNIIYPGQTLSADDSDLLLFHLNGMHDDWNADRLCLYKVTTKTRNLAANKYAYEIGVGAADFGEVRPLLIQSAAVVIGGLEHDIKVWNSNLWAGANSRQLPDGVYCDYDWPIANLQFDPPPSCASSTQLRTMEWQPLPSYSAVTDAYSMPAGYLMTTVTNLAVRSAADFQKQLDQVTAQFAADAKARLRAQSAIQLQGTMAPQDTGQVPVSQPVPALQPQPQQ